MASRRNELHLRLTAWIALASAGVAVVTVFGMSSSGIREEFSRQGLARTRQLASLANQAAGFGARTYLVLLLQAVSDTPDVLEVAWLGSDGLAVSTDPGGMTPQTREQLAAALQSRREAVRESDRDVDERGALLFAVPAGSPEPTGVVALRLSTSGLAGARRTLIAYNLSAALLGVAGMSVAAWWLLGWLLRPVESVVAAIEGVAQGRPDPGLDPARLGALAPVGRALQSLADSHEAIDRRVEEMADRHDRVIERVLEATTATRTDLSTQSDEVAAASQRLAASDEAIASVESELAGITRWSAETIASLRRLDGSLDRVGECMRELEQSVDGSASASVEMAASIRQVAENTGAVRGAALETADSISLIDSAVQAVGEAVREASDLSREVSRRAEAGEESVRAIAASSQEARTRAADARDTHGKLEARIGNIGDIAEAIDSINRETHMLALNASIVAAQAGESGRSFAVVAERVGALASQTAASTAQIEEHLQALQAESQNAIRSLDSAVDCIEDNVLRARETGASFEEIRGAADRATGRIGEIAQLALEQGESSRRVAEAARATSQMVESIGTALEQQQGASALNSRTAESALAACREVVSAAESQRATGRAVAESVGSLEGRTRAIHAGVSQYVHASRAVSDAVGQALEGAREGAQRMLGLAEAVQTLRSDWKQLRRELANLRSGAAGDPDAEPG